MTVRIVTRRPPPWRRFSTLAAVENEIGVGVGSSPAPGFGAPAGFLFPGTPTLGAPNAAQTTQVVWNQVVSGTTVPQIDAGWTVLYQQRPDAFQDGYWIGPFHVGYLTDWNAASVLHYAGVGYPYPVGPENNATSNAFEISIRQADNYVYEDGAGQADIPVYGATYKTVARISVSGGNLIVEVFPMWVSASNRGPRLLDSVSLASRSHPTAAQRCWTYGDAHWNPGNERYNGLLQPPSLYTALDGSVLTDAEVDSAWSDPLHSSVSARCWHANPAPEDASDISDKSGNGNDPVFVVGASAPAITRELF